MSGKKRDFFLIAFKNADFFGGGAEVSVTNGSGIPKTPCVKISTPGVTGILKQGVTCTFNTVQDHHRNNSTCPTH